MVEAVAVIVETGFDIVVLCREAVSEKIGERARLRYVIAEGVVGVLGNGVTVCVEVASYVSVVVVAWNVELLSGGVRSGGVADFVVCAELGPH